MYFLRLAMLKPAVEEIAEDTWGDFEVFSTDSVGRTVSEMLRMLDRW